MLRDVVIFLAGAEAFHTLSHIFFAYLVPLPVDMTYFSLTFAMNNWAIILNGAITAGLLLFAASLRKH